MKYRIFSLLTFMMASIMPFTLEAKGVIDILNSHLIRIEPQKNDYSLVFEIECAYKGVENSNFAFIIVPLDEEMVVLTDSNGEPKFTGELYRMEENTGTGVVEVEVPFSTFPTKAKEFNYACMIIDDDTMDTVADEGPFSFTEIDMKQLLSQKAMNQAMDFLDFLLGGSGSGSSGGAFSEWGDKYDKDGYKLCSYCGGSGRCTSCSGHGKWADEKCINCNGSGKCVYCSGKGRLGAMF